MSSMRREIVLRKARNWVLSVLRSARDVLRTLRKLKKMPRRTVLSLLRRMDRSFSKRTRSPLKTNLSLSTTNPRYLHPRRLLSKMKLTSIMTRTSTGPKERRKREASTTRVRKRGLRAYFFGKLKVANS